MTTYFTIKSLTLFVSIAIISVILLSMNNETQISFGTVNNNAKLSSFNTNANSVEDTPSNDLSNIPIISDGSNEYIVWSSKQVGNSEIFFTRHTPTGFLEKINISNSPDSDSIYPSLSIYGSKLSITWWEHYTNGTQIPAFRSSSDQGVTFGGITLLSNIKSR